MYCLYYRKNRILSWSLVHAQKEPITLPMMRYYAKERKTGYLGVVQFPFPFDRFSRLGHPRKWTWQYLCKELLEDDGWKREQRSGRRQWVKGDPRQIGLFDRTFTGDETKERGA